MFKYTMILTADSVLRGVQSVSPTLAARGIVALPGLEDPLQGGSGHPGLKTLGYSLSPLE